MDVMGSKLSERIDQLSAKDDSLAERMNVVADRLTAKIDSAMTLALTLYVALAAAMFGTMARAFGWI
jgi:hypothetical protein